ncbi:hypothetical protein [Enterovirga sp.]|jgi:hypothetical protein|nr:hypothetical protein [Enterovirga sp.]MDB5592092.1 hypothetical protein [Enterovirga sp.]
MADTTAGASLSDAPAVFRYSKREHEQTMWVLLVLGLGTGLYG